MAPSMTAADFRVTLRGRAGGQGLEHDLGARQRQRRIARHLGRQRMRARERGVRGDDVEQPHGGAVLRVEGAARVEHALGVGEADLALEQRAVELAVDDAEPRRRDAHPRRGVADAQVAGQRQRAASAHAVARDRSDGGLAAVAQRDRRRLVRRLVDATRPGVGANRGELGDVGTGAEIPARTGQDHDAHVVAAPELGERSPRAVATWRATRHCACRAGSA